jgi:hypothetical protein
VPEGLEGWLAVVINSSAKNSKQQTAAENSAALPSFPFSPPQVSDDII